jgi:hypothetical protein
MIERPQDFNRIVLEFLDEVGEPPLPGLGRESNGA